MFGFVSRRDPATGAVSVTRLIDLIRACGLLVVIVTVSLASPGPGSDGALGVAIAVMLGLSAVAWGAWMLSGSTGDRHWLSVGSLIAMAGAGGALAGLSPNSPAVAVGCAATFSVFPGLPRGPGSAAQGHASGLWSARVQPAAGATIVGLIGPCPSECSGQTRIVLGER